MYSSPRRERQIWLKIKIQVWVEPKCPGSRSNVPRFALGSARLASGFRQDFIREEILFSGAAEVDEN